MNESGAFRVVVDGVPGAPSLYEHVAWWPNECGREPEVIAWSAYYGGPLAEVPILIQPGVRQIPGKKEEQR